MKDMRYISKNIKNRTNSLLDKYIQKLKVIPMTNKQI